MKKVLICLLLLLCLVGCKEDTTSQSNNDKYLDYCDLLVEHSTFKDSSEFFDVTAEIAKIDDGYRYYITIDNPKTAMYNIEAIAIEKDKDYKTNMAANIGIFEENKYSLIPNQVNTASNFVKGVSISSTTTSNNPLIYLMVQWSNKDLSITHREYISLFLNSGDSNE